jgi:hypothetical protein
MLRDKLGKFISKRKVALKIVMWIWILAGVLFLLDEVTITITNWYATNTLEFPRVVRLAWPVKVVKRQPTVIMNPIISVAAQEQKFDTDIEKYICNKWGPYDCKIAIAVARTESGLREDAFHVNDNGTFDYGTFQINSCHSKQPGCSMKEIVDQYKNVDCAYSIWQSSGWDAWTVFQTGSFRGNL